MQYNAIEPTQPDSKEHLNMQSISKIMGSKVITKTCVFAFIIALVSSFFGIASASASQPTSVTVTKHGTTSVSGVKTSAKATATATSATQTSGKTKTTQLANISVSGYYLKTSKCVLVKSTKHVPSAKTTKCIGVVKGQTFTNSGHNRSGGITKFKDTVGSKYTHYTTLTVKGKKYKVQRFYYDAKKKVWRKDNCGNYSWFAGTAAPKLTYKSVSISKTLSTVKFRVNVKKHIAGTASASAKCTLPGGGGASSSASGKFSLTLNYTVSLYATTTISAKLSGPGHLSASQKSSWSVSVKTAMSGSVKASASAKCTYKVTYHAPTVTASAKACVNKGSSNGTVTVTVTNVNDIASTTSVILNGKRVVLSLGKYKTGTATFTGFAPGTYSGYAHFYSYGLYRNFSVTVGECKQTAPTITNVTKMNDVPAGGTSANFCATVSLPGSDSGTLTFSADYGSFSTSSFTASGSNQYCTTYVGPDDATSGTLSETVTVSLRDNSSGLSATPNSQTFNVNAGAQGGRP